MKREEQIRQAALAYSFDTDGGHSGDIEHCDKDKTLITPGILLKNGFSRNLRWHHCDLATDRFDVTVQLGYANKIEYVRIRERHIGRRVDRVPNEYTELYLTHIKYVHQLQDAFRLCGITDKTIIQEEESEEQEFKRGDVIVSTMNEILIVDVHSFEKNILRSIAHIKEDGTLFNSSYSSWNVYHTWRLASEEEKQKLFDKMKEQGLRWNTEKKRVEKIRWRAEYRCRYYFVTSCLKVGSNIDFRHTEDEERWEVGNYFQTEEEAEEVVKILRGALGKFHTEKME